MIEWTESAKRLLNEYCARSKTVLAGGGADPEEVSEDLRRHVEEDVRAARLSVVTEEDVRRILARIGDPITDAIKGGNAAPHLSKTGEESNDRPGFILLIFGVLLPAVTWIFEIAFGGSAGALFDPFPTWLHVVAVLLVPVVNAWMWKAARSGNSHRSHLLGWLNGAAIGTAVYYSVLYLSFAPFAVVGILFFGLGLLPLSPYFALIATPILRQKYSDVVGRALPGARRGSLGMIVLLLLVQFPTAATYYGMEKAVSEDSETKAHGIRVLRMFGNEEMMLRGCYGWLHWNREVVDPIRWMSSGNSRVSADQAREIYYRVTGKPFNSVPPPALYTRMGRWDALEQEFVWDDALGGDAVAQRVKGLSLLSSRMDAVAEPDAAVVYCEWIMEFKNVSSQQREARAQVALPPGSVVSRVTLWIDGEEREAAFGGRSQVRQAYQDVAVVQRRDPILVTTCGPDRILMQCFPVPANGGVMKVKIGITAPLLLESEDSGHFVWPRFLERNFAISSELKHDLWIESSQPLANGKSEAAKPVSPDRPFALRDSQKDSDLSGSFSPVKVRRLPHVKEVWTPTLNGEGVIRQSVVSTTPRPIQRLVIVVDGSSGMKPFAKELSNAIGKLPENVETTLIIASDKASRGNLSFSAEVPKQIQRRIVRNSYAGGQDNIPALETAWDLAAAVENGVVLWIHDSDPVLLSAESGLRQRLERNVMRTRLLEFQTQNGPGRIAEKLDGFGSFQQVPRLGSIESDLERLFKRFMPDAVVLELKRERLSEAQTGLRVSRHIERLWAKSEAALLASAHGTEEAVKLAVQNQLVTPWTGAVVLERKEQYDRHGLTPADTGTVPSIPEPSVFSIVGVGILLLIMRKRYQKHEA